MLWWAAYNDVTLRLTIACHQKVLGSNLQNSTIPVASSDKSLMCSINRV